MLTHCAHFGFGVRLRAFLLKVYSWPSCFLCLVVRVASKVEFWAEFWDCLRAAVIRLALGG